MCEDCRWERTLDLVEHMRKDERWSWAYEFLGSVSAWVEKNEHVTDRQRAAVRNIHSYVVDKQEEE
jgi:hypothetical protein